MGNIKTARNFYILGAVSAVLLFFVFVLSVFPIALASSKTNAATSPTTSTTTLTMTATDISLSLGVNNVNGVFAASEPSSFTVTTDNVAGYTLSIKAKQDDVNSQKLVNGEATLNTISSATADASGFSNGNWGYKPSKLNSTDNADYLPAPTYSGSTLDVTSAANSVANSYTIAIAAKADYSILSGEYSNTFVLTAAANPVGYSISYNKNTTDTVNNMPSTQTGDTTGTSVALSSNSPTRAHYSFQGWCEGTVTTSNGIDSCTGTTRQPGDAYYLDQTTVNTTTLNALWKIDTHTVQLIVTKGSGATTKTVNYGSTASFTSVSPSTGYHYSSAPTCTNSQSASLSGTTVTTGTITSDTVCTLTFIANTFSIEFNANGGSGTTAKKTCTYDENCYLTSNGFSKSGYNFNGWTYNGTSYANGADVKNITSTNGATLTFTAKWAGIQSGVTFNRNNGSGGTGSVTATYGDAMPSITPPTRAGYTFNGYFTATSGGTKYYNANGTSAKTWDKTSATTLYAQWSGPITYSINYNTNGGCFGYSWYCGSGDGVSSLPSSLKSYNVTSSTIALRTPYRSDKVFCGWQGYTSSSYSTTTGSSTPYMTIPTGSTGDKYYKAIWCNPANTTRSVTKLDGNPTITAETGDWAGKGWLISQPAKSDWWNRVQMTDNAGNTSWGYTLAHEYRIWIGGTDSISRQFFIDLNMTPTSGTASGNDYYGNTYIFVDGVLQSGVTPTLAHGAWHVIQTYAANNSTTNNSGKSTLKHWHACSWQLSSYAKLDYYIREIKAYNMTGWPPK